MIKVLSVMMITSIFLSLTSFNPLTSCVSLVGLSLITGTLLGLTVSKWMMLSLILLFLGGMMVIFIYATALSGSQKFFYSNLLGSSAAIFFCLLFQPSLNHKEQSTNSLLWQVYLPSHAPQIVLMVTMLFASLVITVKLTESFKGAMKTFF